MAMASAMDLCEMQQLLEVRAGHGIADTKPLGAAMAAVTELQHDASADPFPVALGPPDSDTAWCPVWNTRPDSHLRQESTRGMNVLIPAEFQCLDENIPPDPSVPEPGRLAISTVRCPDGQESLVSSLLEASSVAGGDLQHRSACPAARGHAAMHIVGPPRLLPMYSTCILLVRQFRRHIMLQLLALAREGVITSAAVSACRERCSSQNRSSKICRGGGQCCWEFLPRLFAARPLLRFAPWYFGHPFSRASQQHCQTVSARHQFLPWSAPALQD